MWSVWNRMHFPWRQKRASAQRSGDKGTVVSIPSNAHNRAVFPDPVGPTMRLILPSSNVSSSIRSAKDRVFPETAVSRDCSDQVNVVARMPKTSSRAMTGDCRSVGEAKSSINSVCSDGFQREIPNPKRATVHVPAAESRKFGPQRPSL